MFAFELVGFSIGISAGAFSVWISWVAVPGFAGTRSVGKLLDVTRKAWRLTDPSNQSSFMESYCSLISELWKIGLYRILQGLTGLAPIVLFYSLCRLWLGVEVRYMAGCAVGSIVMAIVLYFRAGSINTSRFTYAD